MPQKSFLSHNITITLFFLFIMVLTPLNTSSSLNASSTDLPSVHFSMKKGSTKIYKIIEDQDVMVAGVLPTSNSTLTINVTGYNYSIGLCCRMIDYSVTVDNKTTSLYDWLYHKINFIYVGRPNLNFLNVNSVANDTTTYSKHGSTFTMSSTLTHYTGDTEILISSYNLNSGWLQSFNYTNVLNSNTQRLVMDTTSSNNSFQLIIWIVIPIFIVISLILIWKRYR